MNSSGQVERWKDIKTDLRFLLEERFNELSLSLERVEVCFSVEAYQSEQEGII